MQLKSTSCVLAYEYHLSTSTLADSVCDSSQVQSGGSFDIDYSVVGPNDRVVMANSKERQGDFVFTATESGEYRVCFNNDMSTFAEKMVDFEIAVRRPLSVCFYPWNIVASSQNPFDINTQTKSWVYGSNYSG